MTIVSRVGELDQALREIAALHVPAPVEVEWFHDPESTSCPDLRGCAGHFRTIRSCTECGETTDPSDGMTVVHREWPCPTVQRIRAVLGADVA